METFIILGKWTQQGITKVKQAPGRIEAVRKATETAGGRMVAWYLTFGRYDFVVIAEFPSAKAAAALLLSNGAKGNAGTETLRALTETEFKSVVASLK